MKRKLLESILKPLTRAILKRYRPVVIAVTGSVGKTSTKEAIAAVLSRKFSVGKTRQNLNTEVGLMIALMNGVNAKGSVGGWVRNVFCALRLIIFRSVSYPEYMVIEMGADRPGDIRKLINLARPQVGVVTAIGDIPVHVAHYKDIDAVAYEKQGIIEVLEPGNRAILNGDDPRVISMQDHTQAGVLTFGFSEHSSVRIVDYAHSNEKSNTGRMGIFFRLQYQGSSVPIHLSGVLGRPYAYACAAAAAVGIAHGMHLVDVAKGLESFEPEKGRMRMIPGIKQTTILDDSYNAAPAAMEAALETIRDMKGQNHIIAVLGDMLELGDYSEQAHRAIGKRAAGFCDVICFVGENMRFAFSEAQQSGFDKDRLFHCKDSVAALEILKPLLRQGDIVLVKGSQGMRMERIVERLMANPADAADLLVRQTKEWKAN
ncbi:MAG: UDP-N-acetylmuramoyl-tripeptide-D-alanyl-D-alanine ligase [Parcubacteria group bacterium GW2011_GWF2_46_8]|nr:MAG: UDP-N-acetylmuramoyl-tripeptide-D-alanyl-D-alanine ligase [Parcubacteria group bacterium GW2011_GWF2_46_8]